MFTLIVFVTCWLAVCDAKAIDPHDVSSTLEELRTYMDQKIIEAKLRVHRDLERNRIRRKAEENDILILRDVGDTSVGSSGISVFNLGQFSIPTIIRSEVIVCWAVGNVEGENYILAGSRKNNLYLLSSNFSILSKWSIRGIPYLAKMIWYDGKLYIAVANRNLDARHSVDVFLHDLSQRMTKLIQRMQSEGEITFDMAISNGFLFAAIGSTFNKDVDGENCSFIKLGLYLWTSTQFDKVADVKETIRAKSGVVIWDMKDKLYLAVAQYVEKNEDPALLYYYNYASKLLVLLQRFWVSELGAVKTFKVDGNYYLILAGKSEAQLYWWEGRQFIDYQILERSQDTTDIEIFDLPNDEVAIALIQQDKVTFYLEDSFSRYTDSLVWSAQKFGHGILASVKFVPFVENTFLMLVASKRQPDPLQPNVFIISFVPNTVHWTELDPLITCIKSLKQKLNDREEVILQLKEKASRVFVTNKQQNVTARIRVEGSVTVKTNLTATNMTIQELTTPQIANVTEKIYVRLKSEMNELEMKINQTDDEGRNLVFTDGDQVITGNIDFKSAVKANLTIINSLANDAIINGLNISFIEENGFDIRKGGRFPPGKRIKFQHVTASNITLKGRLNDIEIDDILRVNSQDIQVITGKLEFHEPIFENGLEIREGYTLNKMSPKQWVTVDATDQSWGQKTFQNLKADNIIVTGTVNEIDLSEFAKKLVYIDEPDQVLTGHITFKSNLTVGELSLRKKINEVVDIDYLLENAVDLSSDQIITGKKIFLKPVHVEQNVNMKGLINNVDLDRQAVTTNTPQTIEGTWRLNDVVFMKDLEVGTVNGIDLSEEAVLKRQDNIITGRKVFTQPIRSMTNIQMSPHAKINGLKISEIRQKFQKIPDRPKIEVNEVIDNMVVNGSVRFVGDINGINFQEFVSKLWSRTEPQVINVNVTILGNVTASKIEADLINGISPDDFVYLLEPQTITAKKMFDGSEVVALSIKTSYETSINGIDFWSFNTSAFIHPDSRTESIFIYDSLEVDGSITVAETVNGYDLSEDVMVCCKKQTVKGRIHLQSEENVILGPFKADYIDVEDTINSVNFSDFLQKAVFINEPSNKPITNKIFQGGLQVIHLNSLGKIDGVDIGEMQERVVTIDSTQTITAPKNFTGKITFKNKLEVGKLNGLEVYKHIKDVLQCTQLGTECIIRGEKTILGDVVVKGNLTTKSTINGLDLSELMAKLVFKTKGNTITAPFIFKNDIYLREVILAPSAMVNGVSPSDFVYLDENSVLNGSLEFAGNLKVDNGITVRGRINNCTVEELIREAVYQDANGEQVISGVKTFSILEVRGNLTLKGAPFYNGQGDFHFQDDVKVNHLIIKGEINGVNVPGIIRDAVRKSVDQIIRGEKYFINPSGVKVLRNITCDSDVSILGPVNGVILDKLYNEIVWKSGNQRIKGKKTFLNDLLVTDMEVKGKINGISLPLSVIPLNMSGLISNNVIFKETITILGNLKVGNTIDGVSLQNLVNDRVTTTGPPQIISAHLEFLEQVFVEDLQVKKSINSIPIEAIVGLSTDQTYIIHGHKLFEDGIEIRGNVVVHGLINGVNVSMLAENVIQFKEGQVVTIPGETVFKDVVTLEESLIITDTLNGRDFSGDLADLYREAARNVFSNISQSIKDHGDKLKRWFNRIGDLYKELSHFEVVQDVHIPNSIKVFSSPLDIDDPSWPYISNGSDKVEVWTRSCNETSDSSEDPTRRSIFGGCFCGRFSTVSIPLQEDGTWLMDDKEQQHMRKLPLFYYGDYEFLISTNSESDDSSCNGTTKELLEIVTLIQEPNESQIGDYRKFDAAFLTNGKIFTFDNDVYFVAAYSYNRSSDTEGSIIVYKYSQDGVMWEDYQHIPTGSAMDLDILQLHSLNSSSLLLVVAAKNSPSTRSLALIYEWEENTKKFELLQSIRANGRNKVMWLVVKNDVYLLLGTKIMLDCIESLQGLQIYRRSGNQKFAIYQHVQDVKEVASAVGFTFAGEVYFAVASGYQDMTFILQWKGHNGFVVVQKVPTPDAEDVHVYLSAMEELMMVTVSSKGHIKIMRAVIAGVQTNLNHTP